MLCHGYHRAYTELFNLVENRRRARVEQGPGGPMSQEIKLEAENHYLDKLKEHSCAAEESERSKQYQKQYTHIHDLANYSVMKRSPGCRIIFSLNRFQSPIRSPLTRVNHYARRMNNA